MTEETVKQDELKDETAIAVKDAQESATGQENESVSEGDKSNKDEKPEKKEWYIDVITALRAKNRDTQAANEKLLLEKADLEQKVSKPNPNEEKTTSESLTDAEINRRAQEIAATAKFNETCNNTYQSGKEEFTDFDNAIANLHAVGALGPNTNTSFLQAVTELPNAHKILHHLGNSPEEAARINALPPLKMAIEMAKIEGALANPKVKPVSKAPAPITPVNGKGKADVDLSDPNVDMGQWVEKRRKEKEARLKAN